jgi:L-aspartate semialdehyde sulfurtransferase ferredoxin
LSARKRLELFFPPDLVRQPVMHRLAKKFEVVFNIRRARISESVGDMVLELEGSPETLDEAVGWLRKQGVRVEPVTHDTVEG